MSLKILPLIFFAMLASRYFLDLCDPLPHLLALFFGGILLRILIEQNQQVDVLPLLQVQEQIAVAATFSLATAGIRNTGFAHTAEARTMSSRPGSFMSSP